MDEHSGKLLRHMVITGGAGFIGSQISERFLKKKACVTVLMRNVPTSIEAQGLGSESEIPLRVDMACRPVLRTGSLLPHGMALVYWVDARTGWSPFDLCDLRSTT